MPGTTRDFIEESLSIRGIPVIITDTAGLHETDDPVEVIGIKKTYEHTDLSDLVLFMLDASCRITAEDCKIYERISDRKLIIVINKSDLVEDKHRLDVPDSWINIPQVKISALYNQGLDRLKDLIAEISLSEQGVDIEHAIIPNLRHKIALERSLRAVSSAVKGMRIQTPFELIAIDIKEAIDSLGEITGVIVNEDMLDRIFSRFCIGK
jgi:tRNA modification GTPase